jgi:hypothetical protein
MGVRVGGGPVSVGSGVGVAKSRNVRADKVELAATVASLRVSPASEAVPSPGG